MRVVPDPYTRSTLLAAQGGRCGWLGHPIRDPNTAMLLTDRVTQPRVAGWVVGLAGVPEIRSLAQSLPRQFQGRASYGATLRLFGPEERWPPRPSTHDPAEQALIDRMHQAIPSWCAWPQIVIVCAWTTVTHPEHPLRLRGVAYQILRQFFDQSDTASFRDNLKDVIFMPRGFETLREAFGQHHQVAQACPRKQLFQDFETLEVVAAALTEDPTTALFDEERWEQAITSNLDLDAPPFSNGIVGEETVECFYRKAQDTPIERRSPEWAFGLITKAMRITGAAAAAHRYPTPSDAALAMGYGFLDALQLPAHSSDQVYAELDEIPRPTDPRWPKWREAVRGLLTT